MPRNNRLRQINSKITSLFNIVWTPQHVHHLLKQSTNTINYVFDHRIDNKEDRQQAYKLLKEYRALQDKGVE